MCETARRGHERYRHRGHSGDRRRDPVRADQGQAHRLYRGIPDQYRDRSQGGPRRRYNFVFTSGGIGPTHDDITADSVAKAFGVGIDHHPEVVARFKERWSEQDLNEARLRMARVPDGAELIQSATILAPGFKIGNVIVMAGIPSIMQAMMDIVAPKLKSGVRMLSESVRANAREGDIGGPLREIANAHPDTIIGSYPFQDEDKKPNTNLVVRSRDPEKLNAAMNAVKEMLAGLNVMR